MDALMRGAATAFAETLSAGAVGVAARRMTAAAWCVALATAFAAASVGCAVTALWVFILPEVGPVGAPLIAAAALLLLCLPLLAMARSVLRSRPSQSRFPHRSGFRRPRPLGYLKRAARRERRDSKRRRPMHPEYRAART